MPFATGFARNLPLCGGARATEFVCEFVFIRDTADRAQKYVQNSLLGIIGRFLAALLMSRCAPVSQHLSRLVLPVCFLLCGGSFLCHSEMRRRSQHSQPCLTPAI